VKRQAAAAAINAINAVITVVACQHVELRSFAVETADDEAGILLDGTGTTLGNQGPANQIRVAEAAVISLPVIDVRIANLVILAGTLPAILAHTVELLYIERNRVMMKNVRSLWPAIFISGSEIHVQQNWVGILSVATAREYLPITVIEDESSFTNAAAGSTSIGVAPAASLIGISTIVHPGGIQVGGPSIDVYILENEIEGGSRNGITLGSFAILDANLNDTGKWTGVLIAGENDDCCPGTLTPPSQPPGTTGGTVVAGGILTNIHIHRNRIRNMGLCGIGPVGFFNLLETLEVITIIGLNISQNGISRTVLRDVAVINSATSSIFGYGAICVPDVQNLIICDNQITDFGIQPGASVCGIFVLHGELLEISRNQVLETRDWNKAIAGQSLTGSHGGIVILLATPPTFTQSLGTSTLSNAGQAATNINAFPAPIYEPTLPAARIEHNVVRVALHYSLELIGIGPFTVANNHLACGGLVSTTDARALAQTVLIGDFGAALDGKFNSGLPSNTFGNAQQAYTGDLAATGGPAPGRGMVLFTGNYCQLEAVGSGQREFASVLIATTDHLIFSNNHCWLEAPRSTALADALLIAFSLNVIGNRLQEAPNSVTVSGLTAGTINITAQNISTYCLLAAGAMLSNNNNLALIEAANKEACASLAKNLQGSLGSQ